MFDQLTPGQVRSLPRYTLVSVGTHAALVAAFLLLASVKAKSVEKKEVEVSFVGPGKGKGPPPPPPPPASHHHTTPQRHKLVKAEIPHPILEQPKVEPPKPKDEPPPVEEEEEDDGEPGGVEGGVKGGVANGVIGGVINGTGGGGTMQPTEERPKPKNVPPFVIARDMIRQAPPRMSEVYKQGHRGQTLNGLYKVCVGRDGSVYEVTPVKEIEGASEQIVEGIKADWLYKPQQTPVCFLYNMVVTVQE